MSDDEILDLSDVEENGINVQQTPQYLSMRSELAATLAASQNNNKVGIDGVSPGTVEPAKKKKNKKKKKKKKKAADQPTGFEGYYVEAPMTVAQAEEAARIYSTSLPITERIEICIQRYRAKRKWNPERVKLFDSYLVLGGIRTGQKAFGGGVGGAHEGNDNNEDPIEMDAAEIALRSARDFVAHVTTSKRNCDDWEGKEGVFEDEDEEWWVDFDHVARAYLSHKVPFEMGYRKEEHILAAVNVVRNFLNYVSFHSVAPEYTQNLRKAIETCNLAEKELLFTNGFLTNAPGRFNTACSALFGGIFHGVYEADIACSWDGKPKSKPSGIALKDARATYLGAVGLHGTPEQRSMGVEGTTLLKKENLGWEIVEIEMPLVDAPGGRAAIGKVHARLWVPEGERWPRTETKEVTLWFEKAMLMFAFVGMRFDALTYTLSNGLAFVDLIGAAYCSFYTYLEPPNQSTAKDDAALAEEGEEEEEDLE